MKISSLKQMARLVAAATAFAAIYLPAEAQVSVQRPSNVVETGTNAWHYLVMEGESFVDASKMADVSAGFVKVYNDEALTSFYGGPILATNTTASMQGALFTQSPIGAWSDKVTYQVTFATPGDYYLYMRFTMFENGGNTNVYINEDSFFVPPAFNKDPQTDWDPPASGTGPDGGYAEGCCSGAGFLYILDYQGNGSRTDHSGNSGPEADYWEGNFHWNQLFSSQFLNPDTQGTPGVPFHYTVTPAMVGVPQNFTIASREGGVTIDLFLFSTHTNLMNDYTQAQLDQLLVSKVQVQDPGNVVGSGTNSWSFLVMEGEDFMAKSNHDGTVGFTAVAPGSTNLSFYGANILATNTTASGKGALYTQTAFGPWLDKVSYQVAFSTPGDYYLYMRFTMFENGGNTNHYINEDSFFLPPDFNKDPQLDWNPPASGSGPDGGYAEGCCGGAGFLYILDYQGNGTRTDHSGNSGPQADYWEGNFHWNQIFSSQFLNPDLGTPGVPFHYTVTPAMVGVPQNFTIAYREGGVTIDLFLFSTQTNLMNDYTQAQLDQLALQPKLYVSSTGGNPVVSWPIKAGSFLLESSPSLSPASWSPVQTAAVMAGSRYTLAVTPAGARYYRLRQP